MLLADDNELNRGIVQELLEDRGLLVETAANGTQAVARVQSAPPGYYDYILMDLMMPETDGFAAAAAIRALPEKDRARIPIIAMTAGVSPEDRRLAAGAGMNGFMEKPLRLQQLFGIMKDIQTNRM